MADGACLDAIELDEPGAIAVPPAAVHFFQGVEWPHPSSGSIAHLSDEVILQQCVVRQPRAGDPTRFRLLAWSWSRTPGYAIYTRPVAIKHARENGFPGVNYPRFDPGLRPYKSRSVALTAAALNAGGGGGGGGNGGSVGGGGGSSGGGRGGRRRSSLSSLSSVATVSSFTSNDSAPTIDLGGDETPLSPLKTVLTAVNNAVNNAVGNAVGDAFGKISAQLSVQIGGVNSKVAAVAAEVASVDAKVGDMQGLFANEVRASAVEREAAAAEREAAAAERAAQKAERGATAASRRMQLEGIRAQTTAVLAAYETTLEMYDEQRQQHDEQRQQHNELREKSSLLARGLNEVLAAVTAPPAHAAAPPHAVNPVATEEVAVEEVMAELAAAEAAEEVAVEPVLEKAAAAAEVGHVICKVKSVLTTSLTPATHERLEGVGERLEARVATLQGIAAVEPPTLPSPDAALPPSDAPTPNLMSPVAPPTPPDGWLTTGLDTGSDWLSRQQMEVEVTETEVTDEAAEEVSGAMVVEAPPRSALRRLSGAAAEAVAGVASAAIRRTVTFGAGAKAATGRTPGRMAGRTTPGRTTPGRTLKQPAFSPMQPPVAGVSAAPLVALPTTPGSKAPPTPKSGFKSAKSARKVRAYAVLLCHVPMPCSCTHVMCHVPWHPSLTPRMAA